MRSDKRSARDYRRIASAQTVLGGVALVLGVVSIFWRDWIEVLTGWDPDLHSGSLEMLIPICLLAMAIALSFGAVMARRLATALTAS